MFKFKKMGFLYSLHHSCCIICQSYWAWSRLDPPFPQCMPISKLYRFFGLLPNFIIYSYTIDYIFTIGLSYAYFNSFCVITDNFLFRRSDGVISFYYRFGLVGSVQGIFVIQHNVVFVFCIKVFQMSFVCIGDNFILLCCTIKDIHCIKLIVSLVLYNEC